MYLVIMLVRVTSSVVYMENQETKNGSNRVTFSKLVLAPSVRKGHVMATGNRHSSLPVLNSCIKFY